jgi:hypothetical protein
MACQTPGRRWRLLADRPRNDSPFESSSCVAWMSRLPLNGVVRQGPAHCSPTRVSQRRPHRSILVIRFPGSICVFGEFVRFCPCRPVVGSFHVFRARHALLLVGIVGKLCAGLTTVALFVAFSRIIPNSAKQPDTLCDKAPRFRRRTRGNEPNCPARGSQECQPAPGPNPGRLGRSPFFVSEGLPCPGFVRRDLQLVGGRSWVRSLDFAIAGRGAWVRSAHFRMG